MFELSFTRGDKRDGWSHTFRGDEEKADAQDLMRAFGELAAMIAEEWGMSGLTILFGATEHIGSGSYAMGLRQIREAFHIDDEIRRGDGFYDFGDNFRVVLVDGTPYPQFAESEAKNRSLFLSHGGTFDPARPAEPEVAPTPQ
ncbi:hypothetical protein [Planctomyces sp. SH-PL14]|uniref:hypothetical protein n=1 Tax=Planctomyces sp. SH-PL14 TaxID=1632864 RepID=UPI00078D8C58|nr:hypothetical protein [Planctomyces sp. SH-PL14]AMV20462.1 hypothetical protein VT03_21365 [Planctomyces sp. SH-PL14]